jgi:hypothetical protein
LKKKAKNETEIHYQSIKVKISTTKHQQQFEIHFEFKPWDGHQMVNIYSLILYYSVKYELKYNKTNTNNSTLSYLLRTSFINKN